MRKRKWFCKTGSDVITYPDCSQIWSVKTKWCLLKLQFGSNIYPRFFMELSTIITRAQQQRNATATQFDSSNFFGRRPEEYEGTLIVLTTRNFKESYAQEINLIGCLHQLIRILNELRCHGEVGKPRFLVKFPTVLWQVLTGPWSSNFAVPCYHYNGLISRLLKPVHIPFGILLQFPGSDIVARSRCKVTGVTV